MKTIHLICLALLLPFYALSQSKLTLDVVIGPEYTYRTLNTTSTDPLVRQIIDNRRRETTKANLRLGMNVNYALSARIWIKSGIRLAQVGYNQPQITGLVFSSQIDPRTGVVTPDPSLPTDLQFIRDYWFIEIPIMLRYEWAGGRISPFVSGGISPHIYLTTETQTITNLEYKTNFSNTTLGNFNKFHVVANLSAGLNLKLSDRFQLFGQPIFRYHMTLTAGDVPIREHLFAYGLEFGMRMKLF